MSRMIGRLIRFNFSMILLMAVLSGMPGTEIVWAFEGGQRPEWEDTDVKEPLEELNLYAASAVLMDASSQRVLYEKNGFTPMAMASTTKILTCIVALEQCDPDEEVIVSSYATTMPKVKLYVRKGERYCLRDLLYSLMLESHNDSAVVIAEHIGKKHLPAELREKETEAYSAEESKQAVAAFAELMNRKASSIGCVNSWFITPNGLDATQTVYDKAGGEVTKEHSATAAEMAAIMAYCVTDSPKKDDFLKITGTSAYHFQANSRSFSLSNHNAFLSMMEGAFSGKTGFTNKAGYCYVGALKRGDRIFTVALLACGWPNHKTYKWSDTRTLMEYGLEHYTNHLYSELDADQYRFPFVSVSDGTTQKLGDTAYTGIGFANGWTEDSLGTEGILLREDEALSLRYVLPDKLKAPVRAGTQVGRMEYLLEDIVLKTIPIVAKNDVEQIDFWWCLEQIWKRYIFFAKKSNSC